MTQICVTGPQCVNLLLLDSYHVLYKVAQSVQIFTATSAVVMLLTKQSFAMYPGQTVACTKSVPGAKYSSYIVTFFYIFEWRFKSIEFDRINWSRIEL
jgi:hypothetical protein